MTPLQFEQIVARHESHARDNAVSDEQAFEDVEDLLNEVNRLTELRAGDRAVFNSVAEQAVPDLAAVEKLSAALVEANRSAAYWSKGYDQLLEQLGCTAMESAQHLADYHEQVATVAQLKEVVADVRRAYIDRLVELEEVKAELEAANSSLAELAPLRESGLQVAIVERLTAELGRVKADLKQALKAALGAPSAPDGMSHIEANRERLIAALEIARKAVCCYAGPPCDCKYGLLDPARMGTNGLGSESTGCPELADMIAAVKRANAAGEVVS